MTSALAPTQFIESDHPAVIAFATDAIGGTSDEVKRAVRLFYAVRDDIRYDPYVPLEKDVLKASFTLQRGASFCVPKAILLAAAARAVGIPARVAFADVRNHLTSGRLLELMGTDVFVYHGYTVLQLGGRWIKATPTFNLSLCERFGVKALDFDGREDALLHANDESGNKHMEYVVDHGVYDDVPLDAMLAAWAEAYPGFTDLVGGDFEAEGPAR